jgi:prophage antirepressor-like protein
MSNLVKQDNNNKLIQVKTERFFDKDIHVLSYNGNDYFIAREVGEALEYADPKYMTTKIHDEWADEFIEGVDYIYLEGESFNDFRANFAGDDRLPQNVLSPKARNITILSEQGVQIVCLKSETNKAKEFRRWVAELLSNIRKGIQPQIVSQNNQTNNNKLDLAYKRLESQNKKLEAQNKKLAFDLLKFASKQNFSQDQIQALTAHLTQEIVGKSIPNLLPPAPKEKFYSPTEMGNILGLTGIAVGKLLMSLGLHGSQTTANNNKLISKVKGKNNPKVVPVFEYNIQVLDKLKKHLEKKNTMLGFFEPELSFDI